MEYVTGLLVFVVLAMTGINYYIKNKDVVVVKSKIDGRNYRVNENILQVELETNAVPKLDPNKVSGSSS